MKEDPAELLEIKRPEDPARRAAWDHIWACILRPRPQPTSAKADESAA